MRTASLSRFASLSFAAGVIFACAFFLPAVAGAQEAPPAEEQLSQAREQILYARYDEAIASALTYLDRVDLSAAQRNAGLEVLATAHIANRDDANASPVLRELYTRDPGHRLSDPDASPLVSGAFARAREQNPPPVRVQLLNESPVVLSRRESPVISINISTGRDAVQEVRLSFRTGTSPRYTEVVLNVDADGHARGRIPLVGDPSQPQRVYYYLHALAPSLAPLGQLGSMEEPLSLTVPPVVGTGPAPAAPILDDERPPALLGTTQTNGQPNGAPEPTEEASGSKWWVGLLVGAVVVGAGVGLYYGLRGEEPMGTLGTVELQ